ncbi:phage tail sheath subtilisin-like domain-containing protein [Geomicrobium sediminis]|uniref:Tail sheath protein subtilisin-like domain-containing protein n=1 Tax=Geomicrobium sediminis TaxID=1347788 RepID=A0ABS2PEH0_9BACL|nr:phage tail sheath subtilisin-like domain-containing protein [Geomicrobium sediminis]MBM7633830.1 hypothetical protein [Geomicrobium sediminis]
MSGRVLSPNVSMPRPGSFVHFYNAGYSAPSFTTRGVTAAILAASFGAVGEVTTIRNPEEIVELIGPNEEAEKSFQAGTQVLHVVRVGSGGKTAKTTIGEIELETKHPTERKFNVSIRESLVPGTKDFILFEKQHLLERFDFESGSNETDELINLINERSKYLTAKKRESSGGGDEEIESMTANQSLTGGENPEVRAGDYAEIMNKLDKYAFMNLFTDVTDMQVHVSLQTYISRRFNEGLRCFGVVGEGLGVRFSERKANALSFDDFKIVYVGNGFLDEEGQTVEGSGAVAYVAGVSGSVDYRDSLTHKRVVGSTGIYSDLDIRQYDEAAKSGMLVFSESNEGSAMIDYGINTKTTFDENEDLGWNKIRRLRTRYELIDRLVGVSDGLIERGMDTNDDGRAQFIMEGNEVIQNMPGIDSGEIVLSTTNPPHGDSAWYEIINITDLDSVEKYHLNFGFRR